MHLPALVESTILIDAFDPYALPSGVYTVGSGTAAYVIMRSLVEQGLVEDLGERDEVSGQIVMTVQVPGPRQNQEEWETGRVKLGKAYLQNPLREYSEWPVKWWREVVQNGVDAGATRMALDAYEQPDGTWKLTVQDNGSGMDREVLLEKFLNMGGTTKTGMSTTGGFGKAKELILFPWISWRIRTQYMEVEGEGDEYRSRTLPEWHDGVLLEVVQASGNHTCAADALEFLQRSYIWSGRVQGDVLFGGNQGTVFTVNGERFSRTNMCNVSTLTPLRESESYKLYFIPSKKTKSGYVWIRKDGLFMFSRGCQEVPGQIVVELLGNSLELMTSNRDGFQGWHVGRALDSFANELAADTTSALKPKKGLLKQKWERGRKQRAIAPSMPYGAGGNAPQVEKSPGRHVLTPGGKADILEQLRGGSRTFGGSKGSGGSHGGNGGSGGSHGGNGGSGGGYQGKGGGSFTAVPGGAGEGSFFSPGLDFNDLLEMTPELLDNLIFRSDRQLENALKQLVWEPDFITINEVENLRVPSKFLPETMTPTIMRLAAAWTEVCRWVLMQLGCGEEYAVGWIFDKDTRAAYLKEGEEHWLLLNPYATSPKGFDIFEKISEGQLKSAEGLSKLETISVTSRDDFKLLYALAVHEVTHFSDLVSRHDEAFASAFTQNVALTADGMRMYRTILAQTAKKRVATPKVKAVKKESEPPVRRGDLPPEIETLRILASLSKIEADLHGIGDITPYWELAALETREAFEAYLHSPYLDFDNYSQIAPEGYYRTHLLLFNTMRRAVQDVVLGGFPDTLLSIHLAESFAESVRNTLLNSESVAEMQSLLIVLSKVVEAEYPLLVRLRVLVEDQRRIQLVDSAIQEFTEACLRSSTLTDALKKAAKAVLKETEPPKQKVQKEALAPERLVLSILGKLFVQFPIDGPIADRRAYEEVDTLPFKELGEIDNTTKLMALSDSLNPDNYQFHSSNRQYAGDVEALLNGLYFAILEVVEGRFPDSPDVVRRLTRELRDYTVSAWDNNGELPRALKLQMRNVIKLLGELSEALGMVTIDKEAIEELTQAFKSWWKDWEKKAF